MLIDCIKHGIAFHHAGLSFSDRQVIAQSYIDGSLGLICCTSTLSIGVNLPCHMVIVKNTVTWSEAGCNEYTDAEVVQMLGRAGRPQFDQDAVAIILTRSEKVEKYSKMVRGEEPIESV